MTGNKVESFLKSELKKKNALLFVLIDSEVSYLEASSKLAKDVEKIGASAILVGGSSATDQIEMAQVVKGIKQGIKIPIILFPGNVTGVVPDADAILFSSLMNSENPKPAHHYHHTGTLSPAPASLHNTTITRQLFHDATSTLPR